MNIFKIQIGPITEDPTFFFFLIFKYNSFNDSLDVSYRASKICTPHLIICPYPPVTLESNPKINILKIKPKQNIAS